VKKQRFPNHISSLKNFLVKNGWVVEDEDEWMLSYDDKHCIRYNPSVGHAVDIEFMSADGKEFFVFTSVKSLLEYCREQYMLDAEKDENGDTNDDPGVTVYMDGIGEDTFDSVEEALEYLNGRITITVKGKKRKLK